MGIDAYTIDRNEGYTQCSVSYRCITLTISNTNALPLENALLGCVAGNTPTFGKPGIVRWSRDLRASRKGVARQYIDFKGRQS